MTFSLRALILGSDFHQFPVLRRKFNFWYENQAMNATKNCIGRACLEWVSLSHVGG